MSARVLLVSSSPSLESRSSSVLGVVDAWLRERGHATDLLSLRTLPSEDLLLGRADAPAIRDTLARVEAADGLVISTPIYKAAYTGLLKVWLDVLPQFALTGKAVLPIATGGSLAHVLAIDYALRPVLSSMGPRHIAPGWFILDRLVDRAPDGATTIEPDTEAKLRAIVDAFRDTLPSR
jgi:FMN reductase